MCGTCGCSHHVKHEHHDHHSEHTHTSHDMLRIEQDILAKNDAYAGKNWDRLREAGTLAINLVSSPGSGKTTLLVKTIELLKSRLPIAVIEGDQETSIDAERIRATGVPRVQINTGRGCHLDAHMVGHALESLPLKQELDPVRRECRQSRLSRGLRSRRGSEGGDPLGDGGRRQASQISGRLCCRQHDGSVQD